MSFYAKMINQYIKPKENFWYIIWIKEGRKMKILLPDTVGYKANLHTHTADSDGICTAEEVKRYYRAHGYSILAYTDHLYMRDRSALSDENFVALSGYENCIHDGGGANADKAYHLNFYAPQPDNVGMVGVAERFYNFFNIELTKKSERELEASPVLGGFCDPTYSVENVNGIIAQARALGYLVVYNHPVWSCHEAKDYLGLKGLSGMEIVNYSSFRQGIEPDDMGIIYDQMLKDGQRLYCFANDDVHRCLEKDSLGGFNIMYPERLDYQSVFECMKNGRFYASTGAKIRGIAVDGNKIYVGAENARSIRLSTDGRFGKLITRSEPVKEAVFELNEYVKYFRISVEDFNGKKAFSRAYFADEFRG